MVNMTIMKNLAVPQVIIVHHVPNRVIVHAIKIVKQNAIHRAEHHAKMEVIRVIHVKAHV